MKKKDDVQAELRKLVVKQLGVQEGEVIPGAKFKENLGADSLDITELVMKIEEEFGINIPDEDIEKLSNGGKDEITFGQLVNYVFGKTLS